MPHRAALVFFGVVLGFATPATARAIGDSESHIRLIDPRLGDLIREGMDRSPTLRRMVEQVEAGDVIVYFESRHAMKGGLLGAITWIGATDDSRFVRASIKARPRSNMLISILAHELQHVLEIGDAAWIRDDAELQAYYERVGVRGSMGDTVWDSRAAREVEERVLRELNTSARVTQHEAR